MELSSKLCLASSVAIVLSCGPVQRAEAQTRASSLAFVSEPGDPIGQGATHSFTDATTARQSQNQILVTARDGTSEYQLVLRAPEGQPLRRGVYEAAVLASWDAPADRPAMHFYGDNRGCGTVDGRFEIEQIRFGAFGYVEKLEASFEQRCNGSGATLWGDVIVNNPRKPPAMRVLVRALPIATVTDNELRPRYVLACQYQTGGRVRGRLEQTLPGGEVVEESFEDKQSCGPKPAIRYLPMTADRFRRGTAVFTIEVSMDDPNYSQYETDAAVEAADRRSIRIR
jgi:hypothetical protein